MEISENISQSGTFSLTTKSSLLREIQSGSESAWHEFYSRYAAMISRIGEKRQLTAEECDDLMIDVMVIFWKKVDSYLSEPQQPGAFRK